MSPSFSFDFSGMWMERLHPMDDAGTAVGTVVASCGDENHAFVVSPWWDNDGTTGEILSCSCGFKSRQFSGHGAWQAGHDGPPEKHVLDDAHSVILDAVRGWEQSHPWLEDELDELFAGLPAEAFVVMPTMSMADFTAMLTDEE